VFWWQFSIDTQELIQRGLHERREPSKPHTMEAPGANDTLSFAIRNIHANASVFSSRDGPPARVLVHLKVSPESIVTVISSVRDVALVQPALKFAVVKPEALATGRKISDVFVRSFSADGDTLGFLRFTSLQPLAFMPRAAETNGDNADTCTGTRLKVEMCNIPAGVRAFVSIANCGGREKARLITSELDLYRERRATNILDEIAVAEATLENGRANAVWEVIASDLGANEVLDFAAFLKYDAHPEANMPPLGCATIAGGFAPTPPAFPMGRGVAADIALPIPRFLSLYEPAMNWFAVELQRTSLLFPFVSNQQGFDTDMIISNVSAADPRGTPPQAGAFALYFYGENAPGIGHTSSVPAGQVHSTLASSVAPASSVT
jgi:hypothetical protein